MGIFDSLCLVIHILRAFIEADIFRQIIVGIVASLVAALIVLYIVKLLPLPDTKKKPKKPPSESHIKSLPKLETHLSFNRKSKILDLVQTYQPKLVEKRKKHLNEVKHLQKRKGEELYVTPAWYCISTTDSDSKWRLSMGFSKKGCAYWRKDPRHLGCYNCGYGSNAIQSGRSPTTEELLWQFFKTINWARGRGLKFDVIEFLCDGSFFNYDDEFPAQFPIALFVQLKQLTYIKRILLESRPEYITGDKIEILLDHLRPDQKLEIGMGLETADNFIREACIHKGYGKKQFERAVQQVAKFKDRCTVLVYILVKPAFLTEKEAIEDVIETLKYFSETSEKYGVEIVPKLEPSVIARGTMLEILHFEVKNGCEEKYDPFSYWGVVEILARAHLLGINSNIRVGAREDMEIIEKVPAIYNNDGTFNNYDYLIYQAVQQYNTNHNIIQLLADIQIVLKRDATSFDNWKERTGIHEPAITKCYKLLAKEIEEVWKQRDQRERERFFLSIFNVLDEIELPPESQKFARKIKKQKSPSDQKAKIGEFINDKFRHMHNVYAEVNSFFFERDGRRMLRIYFQLRNIYKEGVAYDIWVGIPTVNSSLQPTSFRRVFQQFFSRFPLYSGHSF